MPKQKDLKRLTRARMEKTGESYTAARANLIAKQARRSAAPAPAPPLDYAALAGMSEEAVLARTGRSWAEWVAELDRRGAASLPHAEIARMVHDGDEISGWWAQSVTVGYERIKGLREIGQRRDGGYEATKSKTVPAPVAAARRAFSDRRTRERWMPEARPTLRKTRSEHGLRFTWEDGTAVDVWFTAKGDAKTQVAIAHRKLASKADVAARKAWWGERLDALAALLRS